MLEDVRSMADDAKHRRRLEIQEELAALNSALEKPAFRRSLLGKANVDSDPLDLAYNALRDAEAAIAEGNLPAAGLLIGRKIALLAVLRRPADLQAEDQHILNELKKRST